MLDVISYSESTEFLNSNFVINFIAVKLIKLQILS